MSFSAGSVGALAERVFREWLHQGDDQPAVVAFATSVDATQTNWQIATSTLAPDELELVAPGVVLEADDGEQALVSEFDEASGEATVRRGYAGTTPAAHDKDSPVTIAPVFTRQTVLDAVADTVVGLYPSLWATSTEEITTDRAPIEVPASVAAIESCIVLERESWRQVSAHLLKNLPTSSTGKAIMLSCVPTGIQAFVTYRSRFERPTDPNVIVADLGVEPEWERIVVVGAAAHAAGARDLDQLTAPYITEQMEREALPNQATGAVRDGLLRMYAIWLAEASRSLRAREGHVVTYTDPRWGGSRR